MIKNNKIQIASKVPIFPHKIDVYGSLAQEYFSKSQPVYYSFDIEACKHAHFQKMNLDFQRYHDLQGMNKEQAAYYKQIIETEYNRVEPIISYSMQSAVRSWLPKLKCFADVSFEEYLNVPNFHDSDASFMIKSAHQFISICEANTGGEHNADTVSLQNINSNSNSNIIYAMYIRIEPHVKVYSEYEDLLDITFTVLRHEILHALGLMHPKYVNMNQQNEFRSIMETTEEGNALYLAQRTLIDKHTSTLCKDINDTYICKMQVVRQFYKEPSDITAVDVKSLISIWGESKDSSEYCNTHRESFANKYNDLVTLIYDEFDSLLAIDSTHEHYYVSNDL